MQRFVYIGIAFHIIYCNCKPIVNYKSFKCTQYCTTTFWGFVNHISRLFNSSHEWLLSWSARAIITKSKRPTIEPQKNKQQTNSLEYIWLIKIPAITTEEKHEGASSSTTTNFKFIITTNYHNAKLLKWNWRNGEFDF